MPILLNAPFQIEFVESSDLIKFNHDPHISLDVLLNRMGTPICFKDDISTMIDDIITGIENDTATGVFVDCIDLPVRKDTFCKIHNDHCILVSGIDGCTLSILEQSSMNTLNYQVMSLSISDLINASEGYKSYYIDNGSVENHRYFQLEKGTADNALYNELQSYYFSVLQNKIERNTTEILCFAQKLTDYLAGSAEMDFTQTLNSINDVINYYKISKFIYQELCEEAWTAINEIMMEWSFLRMTLFRNNEGVKTDSDILQKVLGKISIAEEVLQNQLLQMAQNILQGERYEIGIG